jgi:hypothetical protein
MRLAAALAITAALAMTACGSSDEPSSSGATTTTTARGGAAAAATSTSSGAADADVGQGSAGGRLEPGQGVASVAVTGARTGAFDTVTACRLTGGDEALLVTVTGDLGGEAATLTFDADQLERGAFEYPTASGPDSLRGDVLPADPSKGTWQFFAKKPANVIGAYDGGVVTIIDVNDEELDFTIGTQFGTTDDSGPIRLDGEIRCLPTVS